MFFLMVPALRPLATGSLAICCAYQVSGMFGRFLSSARYAFLPVLVHRLRIHLARFALGVARCVAIVRRRRGIDQLANPRTFEGISAGAIRDQVSQRHRCRHPPSTSTRRRFAGTASGCACRRWPCQFPKSALAGRSLSLWRSPSEAATKLHTASAVQRHCSSRSTGNSYPADIAALVAIDKRYRATRGMNSGLH